MHNNRIRNSGFWLAGSVLAPAEMEAFDAAQYLSIHEGGGTWSMVTNTLIGGQTGVSWRFTLPLVVDDLSGHVPAGRTLAVDAGGTLNLFGLLDVKANAVLKVESAGLVRVLGAGGAPGVVRFEDFSQLNLGNYSTTTWSAFSSSYLYGALRVSTDPATPGGTPGTINILSDGFMTIGGHVDLRGGGMLEVKATSASSFGYVAFDLGSLLGLTGSMIVADQGESAFLGSLLEPGTIYLGSDAFGAGHMIVNGQSDITVKSNGKIQLNGGVLDLYGSNASATWHGGAGAFFVGSSSDISMSLGAKLLLNGPGTAVEVTNNVAANFRTSTSVHCHSGSTLQVDSGATCTMGANIDRSGADIPSGVLAFSGIRPPATGPSANSFGQDHVDVDLSRADIWRVPQLTNPTTWKLVAPPNSTPMFVWIRQDDVSAQGSDLTILDNAGGPLATMSAIGAGSGKDGALLVFFDGARWKNMLPYPSGTGLVHTDTW